MFKSACGVSCINTSTARIIKKLTGTVLAGAAAGVLGTELELDEALDAGTGALLAATGLATDGGNLVARVEAQSVVDHPGGVLLAILESTGVGAGQKTMGVDRIGIDGGRAEELLLRSGRGGSATEESYGKGGELHLFLGVIWIDKWCCWRYQLLVGK